MQQSPKNRTGLTVAIWIILGFTVGAGLGLLFGWVIMPIEYVDTTIADLEPECKDEYLILVASAYALDHDLEKAQSRLAELEVPNSNQWLSDLIDRSITAQRNEADVQALVVLADGLQLSLSNASVAAYRPSPTPRPTSTPPPAPTEAPTYTPTATPVVPTDTPVPPSDTPAPEPTDTYTPVPRPSATNTNTPLPPTATPTPKPQASNTPKPPPKPSNTPVPPQPPKPKWSWTARLVGPGEDGQGCGYGNLQIRITAVDANGGQIGGVWLYDKYSKQYQVTGNVGSPDFGPGEAKFEYGIGGGGSICIADGQGGSCITDFTRDMPCYYLPSVEDLHAAGYCNCCEPGASLERCRQLIDQSTCFQTRAEHFSWRVVFKRNY